VQIGAAVAVAVHGVPPVARGDELRHPEGAGPRALEREKLDLPALEGSWAGAFGMSQFIPSSYWGYAVDGNGDGRADLYTVADAAFSVGNYLRSFGWRQGLTEEQRRGVVRRYNNSELYAATVLEVAARLHDGAKAAP
ncbi:MAG TPA: lytic murein transglycosylase, partial [Candidatus Methanoperedens sp.]|nr:lytic murein transglycosylase [Candidatus Methanoperedens sp.]